MSTSQVAFCQQFSAPTLAAITDPFEEIGPVLRRLRQSLLARRRPDGAWQSRRGGAGIAEAEAIFLFAYLNREHDPRVRMLSRTLLDLQQADGGWSSIPGELSDADATAMTYFALRLAGLGNEATPIRRSRERLFSFGRGIAISPRTRFFLALFAQSGPTEDWADFVSRSAIEEWAFQVLNSYQVVQAWPRDPAITHILSNDRIRWPSPRWSPMRSWNGRKAAQQLRDFFGEESDPSGPTTVLPLLALRCLRLPESSADVIEAWRQFDSRCRTTGDRMRVTPLLAPQRDTAQAILALMESGVPASDPEIQRAGKWLWHWLACGQARGDMAVDDIAWALLALCRCGIALEGDRAALSEHAVDSLLDEQEINGNWGSPDTTGLVLEVLGEFGLGRSDECVADAVASLEQSQQPDGGWSGTEGQIRSTCRALSGLGAVGVDVRSPAIRCAAGWLNRLTLQQANGSIADSADAALALMAAGDANDGLDRYISRLLDFQCGDLLDGGNDSRSEPVPLDSLLAPLMALSQFHRQRSGLAASF